MNSIENILLHIQQHITESIDDRIYRCIFRLEKYHFKCIIIHKFTQLPIVDINLLRTSQVTKSKFAYLISQNSFVRKQVVSENNEINDLIQSLMIEYSQLQSAMWYCDEVENCISYSIIEDGGKREYTLIIKKYTPLKGLSLFVKLVDFISKLKKNNKQRIYYRYEQFKDKFSSTEVFQEQG